MPTHLSLEKCKKLEAWGMPQEIVEGDKFWYINRDDEASMHFARENELLPAKYYLIPSLETLMAFAKTVTGRWVLYPTDDGWECDLFENYVDNELFESPDPKLAVIELLRKVKQ